MSASLTVAHTLPRKDFTSITQSGLKAHNLATTYATELTPRLPQGLVDGLSDDLTALGAVIPGARQARNEARSATAAQNVALAQGHQRVRQVRAAVRKARAAADVKAAYGVNQSVDGRLVRDVKGALGQIIERVEEHPQEAAALGILDKDLAALKASLAAISAADANQEHKRAVAPLSTQARNRIASRILVAVGRIEGAGRLEFATGEATRASFEALGAGTGKGKKTEGQPSTRPRSRLPTQIDIATELGDTASDHQDDLPRPPRARRQDSTPAARVISGPLDTAVRGRGGVARPAGWARRSSAVPELATPAIGGRPRARRYRSRAGAMSCRACRG